MSGGEGALWAVVPVKGFARGKSRLGSVLTREVREVFARGLFEHVTHTFLASPAVDGVIVVTDDDEVRRLSEQLGAWVVGDPEAASLAMVVDAGLSAAFARGAGAAIVSMADLPRISVGDVDAVAEALASHDVVITPDLVRAGTNMLAVTRASRFPSRFGRADSFAQHLTRAAELGLCVRVLERPGLCFDVDGPEDLERIEDNL